jgi:hypothetical protein
MGINGKGFDEDQIRSITVIDNEILVTAKVTSPPRNDGVPTSGGRQ